MPVDEAGTWTPPQLRNKRIGVHMERGRRGVLTDADAAALDKWMNSAPQVIQQLEPIAVDIELHSVDAVEKSNAALANLRKSLDQFRSAIGNDLTSIKASSARVQTEVQAMAKRYQETAAMLTTPEFEQAVSNAERMAVALRAISELADTKLSVVMFSGTHTKANE